jgi:hypothetical protein
MTTIIDNSMETKTTESKDVPIKTVAAEVTNEKNTTIMSPSVSVNTETGESESEFNRKNVEALGNRVRLTDKDEVANLDLFCYVRCGPTDTGLITECRGVVFNGDDIVMKAFPYTVEYNNNETELIEKNINPVFSKCTFYDSHEGALVRMFFFAGKWYISTHRKLNAFRSKWSSSVSFGTSFKRGLEEEVDNNKPLKDAIQDGDENLLERFQETLDKKKQYMFLIRNTSDNRIVCAPPDRQTIYHVGTFVEGELVMDEDILIPHPTKHSFVNVDELYAYVQNIDIRNLQGVILFTPDNKQYKIVHKDYQDLFNARGNEPSIKFRYLQVRMNKKISDMLYHLYPDMASVFDDYENVLYDVACSIYRSYVQRFIKKRYVTVPREEFAVIRECHNWHEQDRAENRINLNKVIEILNLQTPTNLNRMQRRFRTEQLKRVEVQKDTSTRTRSNTIIDIPVTQPDTIVLSPLLLTKNMDRNPGLVLPPAPDIENVAYDGFSVPNERVLSDEHTQV